MKAIHRFYAPGNTDSAGGKPQANIPKDKVDQKLTLEEEADLTPHEVEAMQQRIAEDSFKGKGSSGPEEKDIAV